MSVQDCQVKGAKEVTGARLPSDLALPHENLLTGGSQGLWE